MYDFPSRDTLSPALKLNSVYLALVTCTSLFRAFVRDRSSFFHGAVVYQCGCGIFDFVNEQLIHGAPVWGLHDVCSLGGDVV